MIFGPILKTAVEQTCARCKTKIWANAPYVLNEWGEPICPVDCMDEVHTRLREANRSAKPAKLGHAIQPVYANDAITSVPIAPTRAQATNEQSTSTKRVKSTVSAKTPDGSTDRASAE